MLQIRIHLFQILPDQNANRYLRMPHSSHKKCRLKMDKMILCDIYTNVKMHQVKLQNGRRGVCERANCNFKNSRKERKSTREVEEVSVYDFL